MKYRFINEHRHQHAVSLMCQLLRIARAGFYAWLHEPISAHAQEDQRLLDLIRHSYSASHGVYGARRVFADLREAGESCGKHRVARIMREHKIKAVRGYKAPRKIAGRPSIIAPNHLQRQFTVDAPDKAWVTDITLYLRFVAIRYRHTRWGQHEYYVRHQAWDIDVAPRLTFAPYRDRTVAKAPLDAVSLH